MTFSREQGIGGSDVAAILGVSPFRTAFDVWAEKVGDPSYVPQDETPQMRFGSLMEPVLAQVYVDDHPGSVVIRKGGAHSEPIWHPNHVNYAHIDGVVLGDPPAISGTDQGIWEGKTAWDDRDWRGPNGELIPPMHYEAQVRSYLAITGEPWCDITVFFRQTAEFEHCRIESNPDVDAGLMAISSDFWRDHVETRVPPPIDGSEGAHAYLMHRFPTQTREEVLTADPDTDALGRTLAIVQAEIAGSEKHEAELKNAIRERMGEYGKITGTGWSATCRRAKGRTTVAWQEVASAYRGIIHQMEIALTARDDPAEALRVLADNPPDAIVGLYTTTGAGNRPFTFRISGDGGSK